MDDNQYTRRSRGRHRHQYPLRILSSLVAVLVLLIGLMRLPISPQPLMIGWSAQDSSHPLTIHDISERIEPIEGPSSRDAASTQPAYQTSQNGTATNNAEADNSVTPSSSGDAENGRGEDEQSTDRSSRPISMAELRSTFSTGDRAPQLKGGMGSLYLHIRYPEAARRAGIQGRMEVEFVVERDGSTSNIDVTEPLHPLTDSSAVEALRRVNFVPGKRDGEPIRVRMRLPIRFSLLDVDGSPVQDTVHQASNEMAQRPEEEN